MDVKGKTFFDLTDEETNQLVQQAAKSAIARTHAAGRFSTHADEKGIYRLYPDGHKEYIVNENIMQEGLACINKRTNETI